MTMDVSIRGKSITTAAEEISKRYENFLLYYNLTSEDLPKIIITNRKQKKEYLTKTQIGKDLKLSSRIVSQYLSKYGLVKDVNNNLESLPSKTAVKKGRVKFVIKNKELVPVFNKKTVQKIFKFRRRKKDVSHSAKLLNAEIAMQAPEPR